MITDVKILIEVVNSIQKCIQKFYLAQTIGIQTKHTNLVQH